MRRVGILFLLLAIAGGAHAADAPPQKFVVFFQEWSAAMDDPALAVVTQATEWAKAHPGETVHVNGFASAVGSKQANVLLADLRAQLVTDQLVAGGIDARRVRQRGRGPVQFALTPQEGRRVEISVSRR